MAEELQHCIARIVAPHAASLDESLQRVAHMHFSSAERLRFGPREVAKYHSTEWFPTGLSTLDDVVNHELNSFNASGITRAMVQASAACCPYCTRVRMLRGQLMLQGPQRGKVAAMLGRMKRLHAEKPLPPFDVLLCDHDICQPPEHAGSSCDRSAPILVHAKQRGLRHQVAVPENTFAQSYGGNPAWAENRQRLLESSRAHPWAARTDRIAFYGSGAGYRKFLNYSESAATFPAVLPQLAGVHAQLTAPYTRVPPSRVPMVDQCASKYLAHLGGTWPGFSNKLKQSLACGAVVVMPQNDWYEFWYLMLRPFEHFVPTVNLALFNGRDWPQVRQCLLAHDDAAARIGAQAHRFVEEVLTPRALDVYMRALLRQLSELQRRGGAISAGGEGRGRSPLPTPELERDDGRLRRPPAAPRSH